MAAWKQLESGKKRGDFCWHRRSGKDDFALHWAACQAFERVGNYWHMLPKANQARKAIWSAVNPHTGKRRIDEAFPREVRETTREQDMMIVFKNGSTWQLVGSDNYDSLVGSPPIGIVFSEYSLSDPRAWEYMSPILRENKGWALFLYTPRGKNHAYLLHKQNANNPDWVSQTLTIEDTGVFTEEDLDAERREGKSEDFLAQEYRCSFEAANPGAYYGKQMTQAWKEGRIGRVPVEPGVPVQTWWDLGMDDSMSIWLTQTVVREIRCVHYYEASGEGLAYYAKYLSDWASKHSATFKDHGMPHDIEVRELGTGKSRKETCEMKLGIKPIRVAPQMDLEDGIDMTRRILAQCWFDETECARGISGLTEYTKVWDDRTKVFAQRPRHDWASHPADAFRTLAMLHPGSAGIQHTSEDRYGRRRIRGSYMSA